MSKIQTTKKHSLGLSIIELMVALVISLIIIGGTASIYLASKRSYLEVEQMARMSQNSRFALQMVTEALMHAGYSGELPAGNILIDPNLDAIAGTDCDAPASAYDISNYLIAATADSSGDALSCVTDAVAGTGMIVIKNVRPMRLSDVDEDGVIETPEAINGSNTYIITNNVQGIMFDGADTAPTIIEGGEVPGGSAWIYEMQIYYVRDIGTGTPQLSRKVLAWNGANMALTTEDLVSGVENMSFLFGIDSNTDGEIDIYRTAANVTTAEWNNIAAIEVNVLVKSDTADPQYTDVKTYKLAGLADIGPLNDNFHRVVMETTVALRNPKFIIRGDL
jgi:type IV pilus assembly protein PilW